MHFFFFSFFSLTPKHLSVNVRKKLKQEENKTAKRTDLNKVDLNEELQVPKSQTKITNPSLSWRNAEQKLLPTENMSCLGKWLSPNTKGKWLNQLPANKVKKGSETEHSESGGSGRRHGDVGPWTWLRLFSSHKFDFYRTVIHLFLSRTFALLLTPYS